ncbi:MAG: MFS transporter [Rhodanobacteraceae bacterium]|nr:MAG: MFS transporter [Rhodanobacteraceae bacterium]
MLDSSTTAVALRGQGAAVRLVPAASAPRVNRGVVFATIALALMMMSIDSTIVATALHTIQSDLGTTINWAGWVITAYAFGFVLMLPVSGKLSKRYGHRRVFLGSVAVFAVASLCCGLVGNIYALIALRALQAAGGAGFTPSATGIIVDHFGSARDRAVGLFGSIFPVGTMIGPIFGGLFVTYWSWRDIFFINVPIGLAVMLLAVYGIPRDPGARAAAHAGMDLSGLALLGTALFTAMFAASYLGEPGARATSTEFLLPLIVALASAALFVRHIQRSGQPFIAPRFIYGRGFGAVNLVNVVFGGVTGGVILLTPLYATNRYGIDALGSGTLLIAEGVAAIALSFTVTMALRRTGYRVPLYVGSLLIAAGTLLLALPPVGGVPPYAWLAVATFFVGAGGGTISPPSRNAGLQLAPEQSSTLAAMRSLFNQLGEIATVSIATAIMAGTVHAGISQAWIYAAIAVCLVIALPLNARVPEHRGIW